MHRSRRLHRQALFHLPLYPNGWAAVAARFNSRVLFGFNVLAAQHLRPAVPL